MALAFLITIYASARALGSRAPRRLAGARGRGVRRGHGLQGVDGHGAGCGGALRRDVGVRLARRRRSANGGGSTASSRRRGLILAALLQAGARIHSAGFSAGVSPVDLSAEPDDHARALPAAVGLAERAGRQLRLAAAADAGRRPPRRAAHCRAAGADGGRAAAAADARLSRRLVLPHAGADIEHSADCDGSRRRAAHVPAAHRASSRSRWSVWRGLAQADRPRPRRHDGAGRAARDGSSAPPPWRAIGSTPRRSAWRKRCSRGGRRRPPNRRSDRSSRSPDATTRRSRACGRRRRRFRAPTITSAASCSIRAGLTKRCRRSTSSCALEPMLAEVVPARTMMGRVFMLQKQWSEAEEQLRLVLSMSPSAQLRAHARHWDSWPTRCSQQQKFAEAQAAYAPVPGRRARTMSAR